MNSKNLFGRFGLIALAVLFVLAVSLVNVALRGARLDLTENKLYTLSDGSYSILDSIPEPINLYFFYSDKATADIPQFRSYAGRVQETLQEFAEHADGNLNLSVIDPLPFSEEEDQAAAFGLQAININNSPDPIYLGIAGTNSVGDEEVIAFLDPSKEAFLEYDLAKLVHSLAQPEKPVIGLLSSLPITAGFDPATQQMRPPWIIADQLQQLFTVKTLGAELTAIDEEVDVLMIVHPKELSADTRYAIDQFVLGGGRALIFVDPYAESDPAAPPVPNMPPMGGSASDLNSLFKAWGVQVPTDKVVGDDRFALTVGGFGRPVRFLPLMGLDASVLDREDVTTASLQSLNFGFSGYIEELAEPAATVTPLVTSSELAGTLPTADMAMIQDPAAVRDFFTPSGTPYVLAARLQGEVPSAFPDGPPPKPDTEPAGNETHLAKAEEPINVILVADTDLLTDRLWAQVQDFFGQRLINAFASNGDFVTNSLDNLTGSNELISIRGRATYTRPFTKVEELRRDADAQFRLREQQLQQQLEETDAKLTELQASREDSSAMILSEEQEAELKRFQEERLRIRKELRQVQRNLDKSIEDLGTWLKIINIGFVPLLITIFSIGLVWWRRQRRNSAQSIAA